MKWPTHEAGSGTLPGGSGPPPPISNYLKPARSRAKKTARPIKKKSTKKSKKKR